MKALFGEGAEPLLTGQFALPAVLQARGFEFQKSGLSAAVSASL